MKAYKCDLCGSFFTDYSVSIKYSIMTNEKEDKSRDDIEVYALTKLDLCFNCQGEIDLARKYQRGIRAVELPKEEVNKLSNYEKERISGALHYKDENGKERE